MTMESEAFLPKGEALQRVHGALSAFVDTIGVSDAARAVHVSPDTMRRRVRGDQPWAWEEVFLLARLESLEHRHAAVTDALLSALRPKEHFVPRPLQLPSELRRVLRLVGHLTAEIADTLDDGRVDAEEARRLLEVFAALDELSGDLRRNLMSVLESMP